jgi:hypothetical protein
VFDKQAKIGGRQLSVLGVVLGQREGSLVESALISAQRLGDSVAASLHVQTVLPAGTSVLDASNADGRRITVATARALSEIGWGGLELPVTLRMRAPTTRLRAGERVASVTVDGASSESTAAVATRALPGPSLGWRLEHLL